MEAGKQDDNRILVPLSGWDGEYTLHVNARAP